mmetsp:Transcript_5251/g.11873  ORF Transcript_5251/g.11873 Transcript_5251/m.11873 type:complete len:281 (-) Transcript_5251:106-948(-)
MALYTALVSTLCVALINPIYSIHAAFDLAERSKVLSVKTRIINRVKKNLRRSCSWTCHCERYCPSCVRRLNWIILQRFFSPLLLHMRVAVDSQLNNEPWDNSKGSASVPELCLDQLLNSLHPQWGPFWFQPDNHLAFLANLAIQVAKHDLNQSLVPDRCRRRHGRGVSPFTLRSRYVSEVCNRGLGFMIMLLGAQRGSVPIGLSQPLDRDDDDQCGEECNGKLLKYSFASRLSFVSLHDRRYHRKLQIGPSFFWIFHNPKPNLPSNSATASTAGCTDIRV